jgi:hypothetical protein
MCAAPAPGQPVPSGVMPDVGTELRTDERVLWVGRPLLAGYAKELLWQYPIWFLCGSATLTIGWAFYSWAAGAGVLWDFRFLASLSVLGLLGLGFLVLPLLWPLRLGRSSYALTTHRLIIRQPALVVLWLRTRSVDASQVRVKCLWTWLPDRTGDITYGIGGANAMERVPHAEEVVTLIRQTLVPPPGSDRSGGEPSGTPADQ